MVATAPPRPAPSIILQNIPAELRAESRWVGWRYVVRNGRQTKVPVSPATGAYADTTDSATWGTFTAACDAVDRYDLDGIGFVLGDGWAGLDIDDCRDPATGIIDAPACHLIQRLWSYAEVSPSQRGVKVLMRGTLPPGGRRVGTVELYDCARFFTITGRLLPLGPATVADRTEALAHLHADLFPQRPPAQASAPRQPVPDDDATLIEKARSANDGGAFDRLWRGDSSGYPSPSEAEWAFAKAAAFWTAGDAARMDRWYRSSSLARAKWDDRRGGSTYGADTIRRAIEQQTDFYQPPSRARLVFDSPAPDPPADAAACQAQLAAALQHIAALEAENERLQQQRDTYRGLAHRNGRRYAQALRRIRVQQQLSDNPYFDGRVTVVRAFAREYAEAAPEDRRADGKRRVRCWKIEKNCTKSSDTVTATIDSFKKANLIAWDYEDTPAAPGKPPQTELYVDLPGLVLPETADLEARTLAVEEYLAVRAPVRKRTGKLGQTHGGPRPSCRRCGPDAVIEETITRQHRCRSCNTLLESHTRTISRYRNDGRAPLRIVAEADPQDAAPSPDLDADPWQDSDTAEAPATDPQVAAQDPIEETDPQVAARPFAWFPSPATAARLTADDLRDAVRWLDEQRGHRRVVTRDGLGTVVDFDIPLWRVKVRVGDADRWYSMDHPADPPETGGAHVAA